MLWSSAASHVSADPAPPYGCYDSVEGLCHHAVPPCWPRRPCRAPARHALPAAPATMALRNCFPPPPPASKAFFGTAFKPLEYGPCRLPHTNLDRPSAGSSPAARRATGGTPAPTQKRKRHIEAQEGGML